MSPCRWMTVAPIVPQTVRGTAVETPAATLTCRTLAFRAAWATRASRTRNARPGRATALNAPSHARRTRHAE